MIIWPQINEINIISSFGVVHVARKILLREYKWNNIIVIVAGGKSRPAEKFSPPLNTTTRALFFQGSR